MLRACNRRGRLLRAMVAGAEGEPEAYTANPVNFDGANDYLLRGGALTGAVNSKQCTGSLWLRLTDSGVEYGLFGGAEGGTLFLAFILDAGTRFGIYAESEAGAGILYVLSSTVSPDVWHHVSFSFDLSDTGKRHLYLDDVSDLDVQTYTNAELDFTMTEWGVGVRLDVIGSHMDGDLADVQIWFGSYLDLSVEANRRLFITGDGKPVDPATAEATLGEPLVLLSGATSTWHTNQGSGGGFTENGALTDGTGPVEI